jgi:prophage DNA circulation protein
MKAKEARKLTEDKTKASLQTFGWLGAIFTKIRQAATNGKSEVTDIFAGVRMPSPTVAQRREIIESLAANGYKVDIDEETKKLNVSW